MKHTDATDLLPFPAADHPIPELTAWINGISTTTHARFAIGERHADFAAERPTLYLDTTVVSRLVGWLNRDVITARQQTITRDWWRQHRHRHVTYVSEVVIEEAEKGDKELARQRREILRPLSTLHLSEQSHELAAQILVECALPEHEYADAHHAAIAAIYRVQVLLTWNCAHLANAHMIPRIGRACEAYGYAAPEILTPEQLIGACAYG